VQHQRDAQDDCPNAFEGKIASIARIPLGFVSWGLALVPTALGMLLRRALYRFALKEQGRRLRCEHGVTVHGFGNVEIGHNVSIMEHSFLYAVDGQLVIGNNFSANRNVCLDAGQGTITIGDNCLIAANCVLRAADHRFDDPEIPIRLQGHASGSIVLEEDVWLGSNVVVTRDVRIGRGTVIGAQSVVTRDIPPYSVAYGVPARVIRSRQNAVLSGDAAFKRVVGEAS
jgi:galactoside O-acetyltransferase